MRASERQAELQSLAEQSYEKLEGKWLEVAKRFEHKAKAQDRPAGQHGLVRRYRYSVFKVLQLARLAIRFRTGKISFDLPLFTQNLISDILSVLYKRAFRKEKEVITFLTKNEMIKSA